MFLILLLIFQHGTNNKILFKGIVLREEHTSVAIQHLDGCRVL